MLSNRTGVLLGLGRAGELSRSELSTQLQITPATVTSQVRRLIEGGFLRELPSRPVPGGRPRVPLELAPSAPHVLGVTIVPGRLIMVRITPGGAVVDERLQRWSSDVDDPIDVLSDLIMDAIAEDTDHEVAAVGLSLPGVVDESRGRVVLSTVLDWQNLDLGSELERRIDRPVRLANGVAALATEELIFGAGASTENFLLMALGDGVGMGVVSGRAVIHGPQGTLSEMGHVSVDPAGPRCRCGNNGCLELYAGLRHILAAAPGGPAEGIPELLHRTEQRAARDHLADVGRHCGRIAGAATTMLGIGSVVITGESTPLWPHLEDGFLEAYHQHTSTMVTPGQVSVRDWVPTLQPRGAAVLALDATLGASG